MKTRNSRASFFKVLPCETMQRSFVHRFAVCLLLSWLYAVCSQIIIPLPFNFVPISMQPLPVLFFSLVIGWPAVHAYILYIVQGACGAPFFSGMLGGMTRLMGPTGGYIMGFGIAALFLASIRNYKKNSWFITLVKIETANIMIFACGLVQLSVFVPGHLLLAAGLYPFIIGDFFVKTVIILSSIKALHFLRK